MHPEVRQFMGGLMVGLIMGFTSGAVGIGIAMHRSMDKEERACLRLPTIHEARRCWGDDP